MEAPAPLFIVGTGRCGSTMLSEFLREHDGVLSLSEFFCFTTDLGGRLAQSFPTGQIDAAQFWRVVADAPPKLSTMLRHDVAMPEVLYRPTQASRFRAEAGVPAVRQTTLPHLTSDAESLFLEVEEFAATLPTAPIASHYARLFAWLTARFGKRMWVERSGASLHVVRRLVETFPGARFLHLVRDGRSCALSMSRHYGFRMALIAMQLTEILGADPFESGDRRWLADIPDDLISFLPETFDGKAFRRHEIPVDVCGHFWSGEIIDGLRTLASLPSDRVLTMRYEDFVTAPEASLSRFAAFLGPDYVDDRWVQRMAKRVRGSATCASTLAPRDRRELSDACAPGFAALGRLYADARG